VRQREERNALRDKLEAEREASARERQARLPTGLKAIWWRLTGKYSKMQKEIEQLANDERAAHKAALDELVQNQLKNARYLRVNLRPTLPLPNDAIRNFDSRQITRSKPTEQLVRPFSRRRH
jgi:hypothetical protein